MNRIASSHQADVDSSQGRGDAGSQLALLQASVFDKESSCEIAWHACCGSRATCTHFNVELSVERVRKQDSQNEVKTVPGRKLRRFMLTATARLSCLLRRAEPAVRVLCAKQWRFTPSVFAHDGAVRWLAGPAPPFMKNEAIPFATVVLIGLDGKRIGAYTTHGSSNTPQLRL